MLGLLLPCTYIVYGDRRVSYHGREELEGERERKGGREGEWVGREGGRVGGREGGGEVFVREE